ncbi:T9SS type A sorting domain-containing protein [bacterium]|nr:T9SS type A sorting domain-containing protein [bacterium]
MIVRRLRKLYFAMLFLGILFILPANAEWLTMDPLPSPRHDMASVMIDDIVYLIGGSQSVLDTLPSLSDVLRFDLTQRRWLTPSPELNFARAGASAAVVHGNIFVFGGYESDDQDYVEEIEMLSPNVAQWQIVGFLVPPRRGAAVTVHGDTILVSGGYYQQDEQDVYIDSVKTFVVDSQNPVRLTELRPGPIDRLPSPRSDHALMYRNGAYQVFGGHFSGGPLDDNYWYDSATDGWADSVPLPNPLGGMGYSSYTANDSANYSIVLGGVTDDGETASGFEFRLGARWYELPLEMYLPFRRSNHVLEAYVNTFDSLLLFTAGGSFETEVSRSLLDEVRLYVEDDVNVVDHILSIPRTQSISAYPNPFNGAVQVVFEPVDNSEVIFTISNILGQQIVSWKEFPSIGTTIRFSWDGNAINPSIPAGVYILNVNQGSYYKVIRLVRLP